MTIRIGSRKSRLALWQTRRIAALIQDAHEDVSVEIVTMDTLGDKILDKALPEIGGKGLFTQELEAALLTDEIDLAVHSLKDLPTDLPDGLKYAGSPERGNPTDALISQKWDSLEAFPDDAVVATGSRRRRAELLAQHPGMEFRDLRGNIDTRLQKLEDNGWDGIVMATVALERLQMDHVVTIELDPSVYVPAVSQGALGVETRVGRDDVDDILAPILHEETVKAVTAERVFLNRLEGGCSVPLGAHCMRVDGQWTFRGWVGSLDGTTVLHEVERGPDPAALADDMATQFIDRGAREILDNVR
jgi:hydroxymethylbilane synthase